jgi:hypothetical protein
MKIIQLLLVIAAAPLAASPANYINFIRQIQQDSGVEWDVTVVPRGSGLSPEDVGTDGSLFQLWSIHSPTAFEYHLDEEFVSAYTPIVGIDIQTGDDYPYVPRTRADQSFQVTIKVDGLINGMGIPEEAGKVLLSHSVAPYPGGRHSFPLTSGGGDPVAENGTTESGIISANGAIVFDYPSSGLAGPDLTKVTGEAKWTLFTLLHDEASGSLLSGRVLGSSSLQVWPVGSASISGIDPAESYFDLPPIRIDLADLYPDSTTWLRVSPTGALTNTLGPVDIPASFVIIKDSIPQNSTVTLKKIDSYFQKSGTYILEVLHQTPFGTDILASTALQIKSHIEVRGTLYSGNSFPDQLPENELIPSLSAPDSGEAGYEADPENL